AAGSALTNPGRIAAGARGAGSVLIAGFSTRALVESATAAGFTAASVDAFADLDNRGTPAVAVRPEGPGPGRYDVLGIARAAAGIAGQSVASVENHPNAVRLLARGRRLLGNPPGVLMRARSPSLVSAVMREHGFIAPDIRLRAGRQIRSRSWLAKPFASGGGHGITRWHRGDTLRRSHFLQQHIRGVPGSLVFVADGRHAVPF